MTTSIVPSRTFGSQLQALIQLTRWREHLNFDIFLTILSALMAVQNANLRTGAEVHLDWRLVFVILGNVFAVGYAFMINDIEDAPDDAREASRAARNPVSSGRLSVRMGYLACAITAVITLGLFALGGTNAFIFGAITLTLAHLYSWRPVRLKAYPVTDVLSHCLMLCGLLMTAGYYIYDDQPGAAWLVIASMTLISVYGQLYNQLRDYELDKLAGLKNSAIMLGEKATRIALYIAVALAAVCLLGAVAAGVFPLWLAIALAFSAVVSIIYNQLKQDKSTDIRGTEVVDVTGKMQAQALVIANLTVYIWLAAALAVQFQVISV